MLENIKLMIHLLPLVTQMIRAAEQAVPERGQGQAKLALVRELLELADAGLTTAWPLIEKMIGVLVRTYNATGVFRAG